MSTARAYRFGNLQDFLDIYYAGADVLRDASDFKALTRAYLERAAADGVTHAEIFFDPQTHTARGVAFSEVIGGINAALVEGRRDPGISSRLILCFLRHLPEDDAMQTLEEALPFGSLPGVGWIRPNATSPCGLRTGFRKAREHGLHVVAHAGEEGRRVHHPALDLLAPSASITACAPKRTRNCASGSCVRAFRSRCVRSRM